MEKLQTRMIIQISLLITIEIILSRFCSISTPIVKIGFAFLPMAIAAILYGPFWGAITGGCADFLGAILFPVGAYFPGFTLTAALAGMVYGLLLHKKQSLARVISAVLVINFVLHLAVNTYWLKILQGEAYFVLLYVRLFKILILIPIEVLLVYYASGLLKKVPVFQSR